MVLDGCVYFLPGTRLRVFILFSFSFFPLMILNRYQDSPHISKIVIRHRDKQSEEKHGQYLSYCSWLYFWYVLSNRMCRTLRMPAYRIARPCNAVWGGGGAKNGAARPAEGKHKRSSRTPSPPSPSSSAPKPHSRGSLSAYDRYTTDQ